MKAILLVLMSTLFMFLNSVAQVNLNNGLVAYYPFNGNANDESGNGYNGNIQSGITNIQDRFSLDAKALNFPGATGLFNGNGVIVPTNTVFNFTGSYSISLWFKWSGTTTGINNSWDYQHLISKGRDADNSYGIVINPSLSNLYFYQRNNNNGDDAGISASITSGFTNWNNVVAISNLSTNSLSIYLNGQLVVTNTFSGFHTAISNFNDLGIGLHYGDQGIRYPFNGDIDDVRIYSRALNVDEIQALYTEGQTVNLTNGLVAYYPFNGNANDESGNGNNGIITGANYTFDRDNKLSSAISVTRNTFNSGSGYVTTNSNVGNISTNDFTFSVWFNTKDLSNSQYLMGKRQNGLFGNQVDMAFDNNKIHLEISESSTNHIDIHGNTFVSTNSWHHAIFMKKSNIAYIYLDGVLDVSSVVGSINVSNSFPFTIGIVNDNSNNPFGFFNGKLDDIRIYNRTINEAEIQALYTEGQTVNLQNGLVAYYPFNGNANDESGNNLNGLFIGSGSFVIDRNEVTGAAYNFTASNSYFYTNDNILLRPQYVSISIWVKSSDFTNSILLQKVSLTGQNEQYSISVDANSKPSFAVKSGGACINGDAWREAKSTGTLLKNSWNHLVGTYDGTIVKFYVNKVLVAQYAHTGVIDNCPGSILKSGFYRTDIPHQYLGNIDDIRIYNRAINNAEIQALYTEGQTVNLTNGLVAYYPFNGNANDESGNGNNVTTIVGALLTTDRFNNSSKAYLFHGNSDIMLVKNSSTLDNITDGITLSLWINQNTVNCSTCNEKIAPYGYLVLDKDYGGPGNPGGYRLDARGDISVTGKRMRFITGDNINSYITEASIDYELNVWNHLVVTYDLKSIKYYQNNILVGTWPGSNTNMNTNNLNLALGGDNLDGNGNGFNFKGKIDDVRIYNRAINEAEIQAVYTEGQTVKSGFYSINRDTGKLVFISFDGSIEVIGDTKIPGLNGYTGMDFDVNQNLWVLVNKILYKISIINGEIMEQHAISGATIGPAISFNPENKLFILNEVSGMPEGQLARIDLNTFANVPVSSNKTGIPSILGMEFDNEGNLWYLDNCCENRLGQLNTQTGVNFNKAPNIADNTSDLDYTNGVLYGMNILNELTPAGKTRFYTLDIISGRSSELFTVSGIYLGMAGKSKKLACKTDQLFITLSNNHLSTASFSDAAYQWYLNDSPIQGTNNSTLANELTTGIYKVKASFTNGCLATSKPVHVGTVSSPVTTVTVYEIKYVSDVENPNPKVGISIYPNPTNGIFYIDAQGIDLGYVEIQNIIGGNSIKAISTKEIDMKGFPNGIYILKLFDLHNKIVKVSKIFKTD